MKLHQLFSFFNLGLTTSDQKTVLEQEVSGIFFDARQVIAHSIFVAIHGNEKDGHEFISQAIQNGAIALVVQDKAKVPKDYPLLVIEVSDSRSILDHLAARFYNFPSQDLLCLGVTGTNGKTSITYLLEHILNSNKKLTGVIGTVNHRVGDHIWATSHTTPDPVTLQKRLREFCDDGAQCAALEVTSHALSQKRVASVHFNTVIFTNLTLDHLDYHKTMQNYFEAKQILFTEMMLASNKNPQFAIVNTDDSYGRKLKVADHVICWTYGKKESDFQFKILQMNFQETEVFLKTSIENFTVKLPLCGEHTIYNVIASVAAAASCGVSLQQSFDSLKIFKGIPGRLQKIDHPSNKIVFVDYAHTPDALENTLKTLQEIRQKAQIKNKLICVFGCGGDRDKSKRPIMGKMATELSDWVVITSDNPRTEVPDQIVKEIALGISADFKNFELEVDREKAIQKALNRARPGDVILIAGKGHEDYQIIGTEKIRFSDFEVAQKYL